MTFNEDTAGRLESLYRELLHEAFEGSVIFDPIKVELTQNMFDQDACHVTVTYDGGADRLDPAKLNRISSQMTDKAAELGIDNTILESYVKSGENSGQRQLVEETAEQGRSQARWQELIKTARFLLNTGKASTGTELETELKTAVECCYFAMYHALCNSNSRTLAGNIRERQPDDWSRVYMGMDEASIAARFRHHRRHAPDGVKEFGSCFAILQEHRDRASERAFTTFLPSEVTNLIDRAESAILGHQPQ